MYLRAGLFSSDLHQYQSDRQFYFINQWAVKHVIEKVIEFWIY
jgi:hypothetical protein